MRQLKIQKSITNRSSEALDKYLVEIGRAPLISIEDEIELAQKIKNAVSNINKNLKIAVMGCIVNGPGEAINSDFGVAGGKDKSIIFSKGKTLKSVKNDILIEELLKLIKEFTNEWV